MRFKGDEFISLKCTGSSKNVLIALKIQFSKSFIGINANNVSEFISEATFGASWHVLKNVA
jgi:hypothetical protein